MPRKDRDDVPKVARIAGIGIIQLAQLSGRASLPAAVVTSRRKVLDIWDRTAVNFPFSAAVRCNAAICQQSRENRTLCGRGREGRIWPAADLAVKRTIRADDPSRQV